MLIIKKEDIGKRVIFNDTGKQLISEGYIRIDSNKSVDLENSYFLLKEVSRINNCYELEIYYNNKFIKVQSFHKSYIEKFETFFSVDEILKNLDKLIKKWNSK